MSQHPQTLTIVLKIQIIFLENNTKRMHYGNFSITLAHPSYYYFLRFFFTKKVEHSLNFESILPCFIFIWQAYRSIQTIIPDHNLRYAVIPTAMKNPLHNLYSLTLLPILQESQSKYLCQKLHDGFSSFLSYHILR